MVNPNETFGGTYPFAPHFADVNAFKMHYVDEGSGPVALCLHGEPTWSYLYRKAIPTLARHFRVIAPDYMGFGKSGHPQDREYTATAHIDNLEALVKQLNLKDITLVVHDWGGAIAAGDSERAQTLMADGVEWVNVQPRDQQDKDELELLSSFIAQTLADRYSKGWSLRLRGRGAVEVTQYVILPFIEQGSSFSPSPMAFREERDKVVWLGTLTTIDGPTGNRKDFAFVHVWTIQDCKIARVRQFTYLPTAMSGNLH